MEAKKVSFSVVDGKFVIDIDPNADGKVLLSVSLDIAQVPAEVAALFAKKEEPAA
jgi:hypothetical protein